MQNLQRLHFGQTKLKKLCKCLFIYIFVLKGIGIILIRHGIVQNIIMLCDRLFCKKVCYIFVQLLYTHMFQIYHEMPFK